MYCLVNDIPIECHLSSWIFDVLVDCEAKNLSEWIDISRKLDEEFTNNLLWYRSYNGKEKLCDIICDDEKFAVPFLSGNDRMETININNVDYYIEHKIKSRIRGVNKRMERVLRIKRGFFSFMNENNNNNNNKEKELQESFLNNLNGREVQLLISGPEYIDGNMILKQIQFNGFTRNNDKRIRSKRYFIKLLCEDLNITQLKLLLFAITALPSLPRSINNNNSSSSSSSYIKVVAVSQPGRFYSHTCFNTFDLTDSFNDYDTFKSAFLNYLSNVTTSSMDEMD